MKYRAFFLSLDRTQQSEWHIRPLCGIFCFLRQAVWRWTK